jgi:hypothetical protein
MLRGTVVTHRRRCGKPNCRRASGEELHEQVILTYSLHSKAHSVSLPGELIGPVQARSGAFRDCCQDGTTLPIFGTNNPIFDPAGTVAIVIGTSTDLSKFRQTREALARTVAQLSEAERIAWLGSWQFDIATGKVSWSNEQIARPLAGRTGPELKCLVRRAPRW